MAENQLAYKSHFYWHAESSSRLCILYISSVVYSSMLTGRMLFQLMNASLEHTNHGICIDLSSGCIADLDPAAYTSAKRHFCHGREPLYTAPVPIHGLYLSISIITWKFASITELL